MKLSSVMAVPKERSKGATKTFEKIMAKNYPNLIQILIYRPQKLNKHQVTLTQKDAHLDTL